MNKKEEAILRARIKELEEIILRNSNLESDLLLEIEQIRSSKKKTKKRKLKRLSLPLTTFYPKVVETTIKILPAIDLASTSSLDPFDLWYDWKTNHCPNCSGTERIKIPEYPTEVCKKCWESRCLTCSSVISIELNGKCSICQIEIKLP